MLINKVDEKMLFTIMYCILPVHNEQNILNTELTSKCNFNIILKIIKGYKI